MVHLRMMPSMWPIEHCLAVGSTHLLAMERVREGRSRTPFALVSREQTGGLGQHGRAWVSCGDGLALSLAWPQLPGQVVQGLSEDTPPPWPTWLGVAVVEVLCTRIPAQASAGLALKWPNDILCHGHKAGGVLVQRLTVSGQGWLVAGIGLNGRWRVPKPDGLNAVGLLELAAPSASVMEWVVPLVQAVASLAQAPQIDALAQSSAHAQWDAHIGEPVVLLASSERLEGHSEGVAPDGRLRLRLADGRLVARALGAVSRRETAA
jgi:Biotin-(acetyl-CoA carboxylase) ligase